MDRTQICCKDFEGAVDENTIIDENTFNHTIEYNGEKLDGWYLGKPTYQLSNQDFTYEQAGKRLNYCPYCGTKLMMAEKKDE